MLSSSSARPSLAASLAKPRDFRDPAVLLPLNVMAAVLTSLLGGIVASHQAGMPPIRTAAHPADFSAAFVQIVSSNLLVAGQMLIGILSVGVFSVCVLLWNAFRIGFDLIYVARSSPQTMLGLNSFLFIEYGYQCAFASVAESGGLSLLWYLMRARPPAHLRRCIAFGRVSLALLIMAAAIEACVLSRGNA
jgi:uncharacterized membrane protein SpoIIM required for sporulation